MNLDAGEVNGIADGGWAEARRMWVWSRKVQTERRLQEENGQSRGGDHLPLAELRYRPARFAAVPAIEAAVRPSVSSGVVRGIQLFEVWPAALRSAHARPAQVYRG